MVSEHFARSEFACKCGCGFDTVDVETLKVLEDVRGYFNSPVIINSGSRCPHYNKIVGGASNSQHVLARAADIVVKNHSPEQVYFYLTTRYEDKYGVGRYTTFTHIDTRTNGPARWKG